MIQIHQLPASTTIADADMIPFDTGSVSKYITAGNLLSQLKMITLSTAQDITVSVDALTAGRSYTFAINSYGYQSATGMPTNNHYRGIITKSSANNAQILCWSDNTTYPTVWIKIKNSTWGNWTMVSGEINGTITRGSMMNTSDTIKVVQHGGMAVLQMSCRVATAGTYDTTDILCTSSIKPVSTFSAVMLHGSNHSIVRITANGEVSFNSSTTVAANNWLIGSITFPVKAA